MAESFWIAVLAVAIGGGLGMLATWAGSRGTVLDMRGMGESIEYAGTVMKTQLHTGFNPVQSLKACALVFVLTVLMGLYPAWRVAKMVPAKALRAS
jgi:ABC-type antimicrobial peptide transport system permease subunit